MTGFSDEESGMLRLRQIRISGEIDDECSTRIIGMLLFLQMQDASKPITLFINSIGGSVTAGLAIYDTIDFISPPVHTYGQSSVCGIALWLLVAGASGHRYVQRDSHLAIAATRSITNDTQASGYLEALNARMAKLLAAHTALPEAEVVDALKSGRDFTASEARDAGIADDNY